MLLKYTSVLCRMSFEDTYVHDVYRTIASHFDKTRYCLWNKVKCFLDTLPSHSVVLDNGCGNGKYLSYRSDLCMIGHDPCLELLTLCKEKHAVDVLQANGLFLPYQTDRFDACISIAVLHHLSSHDTRLRFLQEMVRCTKPFGTCFLTVWAWEQEDPKVFTKWTPLPSGDKDFFIPWHTTQGTNLGNRYYHLFDIAYVKSLFSKIPNIHITDIVYEKSNWCITFTKVLK